MAKNWVGTLGMVLAAQFAFSTLCKAASVIEVLEQGRKLRIEVGNSVWKNGHVVCAVRDNRRIACGLLVEQSNGKGLVGLDFRNEMPLVGDQVISATEAKNLKSPTKSAASTGLVESDAIHYRSGGRDTWLVSSFAAYDLEQVSLGASLEFFVAPRTTYSLQVSWFDVGNQVDSVDGFSIMLHRAFRATRAYRGVFAGMGAGAYLFNLSDNTSAASFVVQGYAGWVVELSRWLTTSVSVGVSYLTRPQTTLNLGEFHLLRPWFAISLGVPF